MYLILRHLVIKPDIASYTVHRNIQPAFTSYIVNNKTDVVNNIKHMTRMTNDGARSHSFISVMYVSVIKYLLTNGNENYYTNGM